MGTVWPVQHRPVVWSVHWCAVSLDQNVLSASLNKYYTADLCVGSSSQFLLQCTDILWEMLGRGWAQDVFLPALVHRFWKLDLQLLSRYTTWLDEIYEEEVTLTWFSFFLLWRGCLIIADFFTGQIEGHIYRCFVYFLDWYLDNSYFNLAEISSRTVLLFVF